MLDPDVVPERRLELRKILGHRIFQRELSFLGELQDGDGRELLRDGCDIEEGVAVDGHFRVDVGDAVAFVKDDLVALHHEDGRTGLVGGE